MGINTADGLPLRITFSFLLPFFFIHFFYCGKMNLAISLGLILSAVVVTARIVKPGVRQLITWTKQLPYPRKVTKKSCKQLSRKKKKSKPEWRTRTKRAKMNCVGCHHICKAKAPDRQSEQACMQACIQRIG